MTAHGILAPEVLRDSGEWMAALGFYKGIGSPCPCAYGLAYRPRSLPNRSNGLYGRNLG